MLRHVTATHFLEDNLYLKRVQILLGVAMNDLKMIRNPLDIEDI